LLVSENQANEEMIVMDEIRFTNSFVNKRHFYTLLKLPVVNRTENKKLIETYGFKLKSKLIEYDSIAISQGVSSEVLQVENNNIELESQDTLKLLVKFFSSKDSWEKVESDFIEKWQKDTVRLVITLDEENYTFSFVANPDPR